jgi:hypothetical protein
MIETRRRRNGRLAGFYVTAARRIWEGWFYRASLRGACHGNSRARLTPKVGVRYCAAGQDGAALFSIAVQQLFSSLITSATTPAPSVSFLYSRYNPS